MERLPIPSCKLNADNCHHKPNKRQLFFVQPASVLCVDCICTVCCAAHRGENLHVFSPDPSFRAFPVPLQGHWVYPVKLLRLRSRGDCLWQSFRSLAAYCSPSAHPRTRSAGCGVSRRCRCCGLIDDIPHSVKRWLVQSARV